MITGSDCQNFWQLNSFKLPHIELLLSIFMCPMTYICTLCTLCSKLFTSTFTM